MKEKIKAEFETIIIPRVYERGWSYELENDGVRVIDGLDVAGDHWDGRIIDLFFPFTDEGLKKAKLFCET